MEDFRYPEIFKTLMKKKIGLILIKGTCILLIISGIIYLFIICNGGSFSIAPSPHDYTYREESTVEGVEGLLYSLGVICVGGIGLFCAKQEK